MEEEGRPAGVVEEEGKNNGLEEKTVAEEEVGDYSRNTVKDCMGGEEVEAEDCMHTAAGRRTDWRIGKGIRRVAGRGADDVEG